MIANTDAALISVPTVRVSALAEVVHDLLAGGSARLHDASWLRERAAAADLSQHEHAALEALCERLRSGGATRLVTSALHWS